MPEVELEQARGSVGGAADDLASARRIVDDRRADPAAGGAPQRRAAVDGHPPGTGWVLYVLRTGCQWRALPAEFGSATTVHDRFQRWVKSGASSGLGKPPMAVW